MLGQHLFHHSFTIFSEIYHSHLVPTTILLKYTSKGFFESWTFLHDPLLLGSHHNSFQRTFAECITLLCLNLFS